MLTLKDFIKNNYKMEEEKYIDLKIKLLKLLAKKSIDP